MKRNLLLVGLMLFFVLCASVVSVSAQKLNVRENGKIIATVVNERTEQVRTLTISREGQPTHTYRSYPFVSAFSLTIGKEQVLIYYSKLGQIQLKNESFSLADFNRKVANYGRDKSLYQQVSDDMRLLRAAREVMPSVRIFETGLVVLTGDSSFLEGEAADTLTVDKDFTFTKTQANSLESCVSRCQNTERRCVAAANGNQASIDRCFENSFRCQENCERVYGPLQP